MNNESNNTTPIALWRARMGLSLRAAQAALGISREGLIRYEKGDSDPPLYIGLACSALAAGLEPYQSTGPKEKKPAKEKIAEQQEVA